MLRLSVIVPVRDDEDGIRLCLDALSSQRTGHDVEVIVVDNGSSDGTVEAARTHASAPLVVAEARRGSYAARNAGIAAASGDVLAFTDADCLPHPAWLDRAVAALDGADAVGGRIRMTISPEPGPWEQWDAAHYLDQETYVRQGFAATANLLVRRSAFDAVGLFDAELLSSGDLEWGLRATRNGQRLTYAADAVVSHRARTTPGETWRLHRRLGAGWRTLAARGERPRAWRDPFMNPTYAVVRDAAYERGLPVREHQLAVVHAVILAARWTGRVTGR